MKTTKKDECSYSFSNAIRTLVMVRVVGLEPTSLAALEPKSSMFTNFIIPAYMSSRNFLPLFLEKLLH